MTARERAAHYERLAVDHERQARSLQDEIEALRRQVDLTVTEILDEHGPRILLARVLVDAARYFRALARNARSAAELSERRAS